MTTTQKVVAGVIAGAVVAAVGVGVAALPNGQPDWSSPIPKVGTGHVATDRLAGISRPGPTAGARRYYFTGDINVADPLRTPDGMKLGQVYSIGYITPTITPNAVYTRVSITATTAAPDTP